MTFLISFDFYLSHALHVKFMWYVGVEILIYWLTFISPKFRCLQFSPFFSANCFKKLLGNCSMTFPLHVSSQKSRNLVVVWWRTHLWVPRLSLLEIHQSWNHFFQLPLPKHSPRTQEQNPSIGWSIRVVLEVELNTPILRVSARFWWNWNLSRTNWP